MRKLAGAGIAVALALVALLDLASARGTASAAGLSLSLALAALTVVLLLRRNRLPRPRLMLAGSALAAASLLLTVVASLASAVMDATWALLETASLLLLLGVLSRRWTRPWDNVVLAALTGALVAAPWRLRGADALTFSLLSALLTVAVLSIGLLRRADDVRAAQTLLRVRNDERRDIARDLHDDVAHHVTGIVVAVQAAAVVVDSDRVTARAALRVIEDTAIEALESMRSLVSVLRVPGDGDCGEQDGARRTAAHWPGDLKEMVYRFDRSTGLSTTLMVDSGTVPTAHQQAVQRVTQEALTNIRRHAVGATRAEVLVTQEQDTLHVRVTDDGLLRPGSGGALARSGGGFGLVGLHERATALGGSVTAGHQQPRGWVVEVTLPLPDRSTHSSTSDR